MFAFLFVCLFCFVFNSFLALIFYEIDLEYSSAKINKLHVR